MKIQIPVGITGKDVFKYLKDNKQQILELKRSEFKTADSTFMGAIPTDKSAGSTKWTYENDEAKGILKRDIVTNTYNWMDSHEDVHLTGIFSKSLTERGKNALHLVDHERKLVGSRVGDPIKWAEVAVKWRDLGVNKDGITTVLMLTSAIKRELNNDVYQLYLKDEVNQHSVGMRYVKIDLAVNAPADKWYEEEYKVWLEVYPLLGNPLVAEGKGYFWAVREAEVIEASAVLLGSNEITPTMGKALEPLKDTPKSEPVTRPLNINKLLTKYKF